MANETFLQEWVTTDNQAKPKWIQAPQFQKLRTTYFDSSYIVVCEEKSWIALLGST
jgi:hypothetical protein